MAKYLVADTSLTAVADAIRTKGGTSEALSFPDGFVSAVEGIQAGGGGITYDDIATRQCAEDIVLTCDHVDYYGFAYMPITGVYSETVTNLSSGAFYSSDIRYADFPNATDISSNRQSVLSKCTKLQRVSFPKVKTLGQTFADGCTALEDVNLPNVTGGATGVMAGCTSLKSITMPSLKNGLVQGFSGCSALKYADMPVLEKLEHRMFQNCTALQTLILRNQTLCVLENTGYSLSNTPFSSGKSGGVLLVPSALVESYKTATNWSVLYGYGTNRFLPLEDYTVDGTTSGEIDWDKVNALFEEA